MKSKSRIENQGLISWSFLTNHAQVLIAIAQDPAIRLRDLGEKIGITERAAHRIVTELAIAGYVSRERRGRRNHYTVRTNLPLPDSLARGRKVEDLLGVLGGQPAGGLQSHPPARRTRG